MSIRPEPPLLPKDLITVTGTPVVVQSAEIKENIKTSIGDIKQAIVLEVNIKGNKDVYTQIFSIDKDPITGSAARVLAHTGAKNVTDLTPKVLEKLVGKELIVKNNGGKLYWN